VVLDVDALHELLAEFRAQLPEREWDERMRRYVKTRIREETGCECDLIEGTGERGGVTLNVVIKVPPSVARVDMTVST
jgi:hypothetical protein